MRILVTGAAGLVGSGISKRLSVDHDVVGMDLLPGLYVQLLADCRDVAEWRHAVGQIDAVVHVAALHAPHVGRRRDEDFRLGNVDATARLLDFASAAGASHFVLTSTTSLYGHALESPDAAVWVDEQLQPAPRDIYDETKLQAEQLVASAGDTMTVTSLRMSRCFPEPAELMACYRLYRGVDRRDVAEAHSLALGRMGSPATYVISAKSPFRRDDCEQLLRDAPAVIERRCPGLIEKLQASGWEPPQSIDRVYDCSLASSELGFSPGHGIDSVLKCDWDPLPAR